MIVRFCTSVTKAEPLLERWGLICLYEQVTLDCLSRNSTTEKEDVKMNSNKLKQCCSSEEGLTRAAHSLGRLERRILQGHKHKVYQVMQRCRYPAL